MLFGNLFVEAFAALGCLVVLLAGGAAAAVVALARSEAGRALVAHLTKRKEGAP